MKTLFEAFEDWSYNGDNYHRRIKRADHIGSEITMVPHNAGKQIRLSLI